MATDLYLRAIDHRSGFTMVREGDFPGTYTAGTALLSLRTTRGAATTTGQRASVLGPTSGLQAGSYLSPPLSAGFTLSGTVTFNVWANETNMADNALIRGVLYKVPADSLNTAVTEVARAAFATELTTASAVNNWTATPTSTVFAKGDRLLALFLFDDAGTMAAGGTLTLTRDGPTAAANGDSYVRVTENITFTDDSAAPTGSILYPTTIASDVSAGTDEREMWTSRGAGVTTAVTNTVNGPTAPIQATATAGGSVIEWYTKQLESFTLAGFCRCTIRGLLSNGAAQATFGLEIAVVNSDGTGAVIWGRSSPTIGTATSFQASLDRPTTIEADAEVDIAGPDIAVTAGQRLRFRVYIDDLHFSTVAAETMVTGHTATFHYAGTTSGASGDSFITLSQSVTQFVSQSSSKSMSVRQAVKRAAYW